MEIKFEHQEFQRATKGKRQNKTKGKTFARIEIINKVLTKKDFVPCDFEAGLDTLT